MQWGIILIVLMVLAIIVLSTVFGGEKKKKRQRSFELDQFLEETQRRQEKEQRTMPTPVPEVVEPRVKPTPVRALPPTLPIQLSREEIELIGEPIDVPKRLPPRRPMTPIVRKVREMLRDPESIRVGFVLNEILQPRRK